MVRIERGLAVGLLLARFAGLGHGCPVSVSHSARAEGAEEQHLRHAGTGLRENILLLAVVGTAAAAIGHCSAASADTLEGALVQAYQNNPSLNAQRAALRAVDENVPQALSGYPPRWGTHNGPPPLPAALVSRGTR